MNGQKHIINREVLEFTVSERHNAQSIQNKISEMVRRKLNPAFDQLFSKMSAGNEIIRIDKLVIDLGTISENDLENGFIEKVINEISDKISILIKTGTKRAGQILVNGNQTDTSPDFIATTKSEDVVAIFIYFLDYGYLPWWSKSSVNFGKSETSTNKKIIKEALNVEKTLLKNAVIPLLKKYHVRKRLIYQFNNSYLHELLKKLNAKQFENYSAWFQDLKSCTDTPLLRKTFTDSFYEIVLKYFSTELELNTTVQKIGFVRDILDLGLYKYSDKEKEKILTEILRSAQLKLDNSQRSEILQIMVAVIQLASELPSMSQVFQEMVNNLSSGNESVINSLIEMVVKKADKVTDEKEAVRVEKGKGKGGNSGKSFSVFPPKPGAETEQIMIYNAGLVLIHPFLRYFFEGLNLLDSELQFKSDTEAFKAVHLLQYIATGAEFTPETDLPLNKILCGLEVTEPVPLNVPLSEDEKEECLFLIQTVLERWESLKTANPAALRDTYLQREGILKQAGRSWNLTIERNTFDVMLERLPWSFGLVKLPWCEQILYVEW